MRNSRFFALPLMAGAAAFGLVACGDDVTEQVINNTSVSSAVESVAEVDSLPDCNEDYENKTIWVKSDNLIYGCDGKNWSSIGGAAISVGSNFCKSVELEDKSGFEIYCNGESIGTVKNGAVGATGAKGDTGATGEKGATGATGEKGDKGDKGDKGATGETGSFDGTNGCVILDNTVSTATIQCASETFTMDLFKVAPDKDAKTCEDNSIDYGELDCANPQEIKGINGQSQKGPFTKGASVDAYELANATLKQTGNSFKGSIEEDNGLFNISTVKLASQYVYLVADGFYRNEVTGLESNSTIRLRALADMGRATMANINLVTHLEYDRVFYLVNNVKNANGRNMRPLLAKKQAESEIFKNFYIDDSKFKERKNDDYLYAEDMNVLTEGDGNAALLAISVLLQGDRTEAQLTSMLASFSVDIARDGSWDRVQDRAAIADWAVEADFSGKLDGIRAKIDAWKLGGASKAPAFEHHVRNFWYKELGLGECNKENVGIMAAANGNAQSAFYAKEAAKASEGDKSDERFICAANGEGDAITYAWRKASDLEKNTYKWPTSDKDVAEGESAPKAGDVKPGSINADHYYVFEDGKWRRGTDLDKTLKKSCVKDSVGVTDSISVNHELMWFICDENDALGNDVAAYAWRTASTAEADTALFGTPTSNTARIGNINKSRYYVYEINSETREGKWRYGTMLDADAGLGPCVKDQLGAIRKLDGVDGDNAWYRCVNDEPDAVEGVRIPTLWRKATIGERDTLGWGSGTKKIGDFHKGQVDTNKVYVYDKNANGELSWRYGTLLDSILQKACTSENFGKDTSAKVLDIGATETRYYTCVKQTLLDTVPYKWVDAGDWYNETVDERRNCTDADVGELMTGEKSGQNYICTKEASWQIPANKIDSTLGGCREAIKDSIGYADKLYRYCDKNDEDGWKWRLATKIEYDTYRWNVIYKNPKDGDAHEGNVTKNSYYVFDAGLGRKWVDQSDEIVRDYALNGCTKNLAATPGGYTKRALNNDVYKCVATSDGASYRWSMSNDDLYGVTCPPNKLLYVSRSETWYACDGEYFTSATPMEIAIGVCYASVKESIARYNDTVWTCQSDGWTMASQLLQDTYGEDCPVDGELFESPKSKKKYGCKNGKYVVADELDILFNKICSSSSLAHTYNGVQYQCNESLAWAEADGFKRAVFLDSRNLTIYPMVTIGSQTWMAKNLNYEYNYGTTWSLCYGRDPQNCDKYGLLYKWSTAMDSAGIFSSNSKGCGYGVRCNFSKPVRGICPAGWHLPDTTESKTLIAYAGGDANAAVNLAAESETIGTEKGVDKYGFSMLLAGHRNTDYWDIQFFYLGTSAYFINADQYTADNKKTYRWGVAVNATVFDIDVRTRYFGYSIRCVKDK